MKFGCPYCRHECDYEDIQMDADLLAIIKMTPVFGKHHSLVWAYCELFGITPLKPRRKKLRLLLEELKTFFQAEEFSYQKKRYRISQAGIAEALNIAAKKNFTSPLENHNYLKKIMIGIAEASTKTESREAEKDLRKREERLRHPYCEYPYQEEHVEPPTRVVHDAPSLSPSRQGREENGGAARRIPSPSTGEGEGGEGMLTAAQREENKRRLGAILKGIGG